MKYELSIIIPSRNEEWLAKTIEDILEHKEGKTQIIVVLDGKWADPPIPDHPDVVMVYLSESIGQRVAQNLGAKLSTAKYIMKVDAHCAFDQGFDVKMMNRMEDDITMVPVMRNLHIFDWVCENCGMRTYQGPNPKQCRNEQCANKEQSFKRDVVWIPKTNPQSSAYRFNKNLQFKYFPELRSKLPREGLQESLSLQGSCFMCTREKYWSLGLCDETWGSWGQQGSEVALKTWLSGGRVLCNFDTWYAHLFRTQHGFSFPYKISGTSQERARQISQKIFLNDKWDKQKHPLKWLLNKFWFALQDVRDEEAKWVQADIGPSRAMIYTTHNQLKVKIAKVVQNNLLKISKSKGIPIVSCSMKPMSNMGKNIVFQGERGVISMLKQIITALENTDAEIVYFTEHDVIYHPSHFDFVPPTNDKFYYNINWWRIREGSDVAVHWDARQVSGLVCYRELALNWYKQKLEETINNGFNRSYEPGGRDRALTPTFKSESPNIDIRGDWNQTRSKWSINDFRDKSAADSWQEITIDKIPGWSDSQSIL